MTELHELTAAAAGRLIAAGDLSPVDLVQAAFDRIAAKDQLIDSFVMVCGPSARDAAVQAERDIRAGRRRGPLHGIPFALKDVYETKGVLTTAQSRQLLDHVPGRDSTVAARLAEAGAILLGKVMTHEFAIGGPSFELGWKQSRNPWNTAYYTGGSSAGAGAAVAADLVPFAMGTDTAGSVRHPAAYCGLAGLKPSFGLVGRSGVFPAALSLDHCGPMARSVEDCALALDAVAGFDEADPGSVASQPTGFARDLAAGIAGMRIGVVRHFHEADRPASGEAAAAFEEVLTVLRSLGARLAEIKLPPLEVWDNCSYVIAHAEVFAQHEPTLGSHPERYADITRVRLLLGADIRAADYILARETQEYLRELYATILGDFDAIVTLCSVGEPDTLEHMVNLSPERTRGDFINTPFSLIGVPALTVRSGFTRNDFPLSMQIAAKRFDDAIVLRIGHAYEQATAWKERRPRL